MTRSKTKKPLTEWDKMTKQQRMEAYTELLKENRNLKRAIRDYQEQLESLEQDHQSFRLASANGRGY